MSDEEKKRGKLATDKADPLIGTVLGGRYRIDTLLGRGAMGRVYRAEHVLMHKPLAVKILNAEHAKRPEIVSRFEREATAAANIDHPNVVAATDFGKLDDGTLYLALELIEGKNLRAEIAKGPLGVPRVVHIAHQVASALVAAHARNIVHRDLKPENVILVEKDGDRDFVKVLDFGIAKLTESGKSPLTKVGVVLGTLDYMAPEQALGQDVDGRADLYALGVLMYEMLSGQCPYEGESSSAILGLQLTKRPPSFQERAPTLGIPGAVEALVMKLLAKDRKERPQTAAAVVTELDALSPKSAGGVTAPKPSAAPARRLPDAPVAPRAPASPAAAPRAPASPAAPSRAPAAPAAPSRAPVPPVAPPRSPDAPSQNKPTFLPGDPLPSFTFPPTEEASKDLVAEVKRAIASQGPPPPPSRKPSHGAPPAADVAVAPGQKSKLDDARARAAELLRKLRNLSLRAIEAASLWIEDHRRLLPRFIKRPLRRVPAGAILIVLVALVALVILVIVLLVGGGDGAPTSTSRVASVSAAPPPASAPRVAPETAANEKSLAAVARAEKELKVGNWVGVVSAIEEALEANPSAKDNERIAAMLGEAMRHGASSNAAFKLLTGPMGGRGAEIVYDVAVHPKTPQEVREKTEEWLASDGFRRVASPTLAISGKLRTARGCSEKRALLDDAAREGDGRTLDYLKILAVKGGCGRRGRDDCFPCLRGDEKLAETIVKIERRLGASKTPTP